MASSSEVLDRQGISAVEPSLNPIFPAGLLIPSVGSVDSPGAVTAAYGRLFAERGGRIEQATITGLARNGAGWRASTAQGAFDADIAVVALGPWSGDLLKPLGIDPKLDVERGYHRHMKPQAGTSLESARG
ncbi:Amino acid dehydrogenase OS=Bosea thiooxidans OX=53254 GN=ARD30_16920 PE=4 SV=1 [Bosea thiooxidans]